MNSHKDFTSGDRGGEKVQDVRGGKQIESSGLIEVLKQLNYPETGLNFKVLEQALMERSNRIRFADDVTFLEIQVK